MTLNKTALMAACAALLLTACKPKDEAPVDTAPAPSTAPVAAEAPPPAPQDAASAPEATASAAAAFDITRIAVSDKPLPPWPYVALPAGYHFDHHEEMAKQSKDLARVPVWTGSQLLWVEGKVFSDSIDNDDGKTFSKFELRKNLQQAIEALGGVRLSERSFDEATYKASEKALEDFRQEFGNMGNAYWYDADADTYLIRRADQAIWVVTQVDNDSAAVMVAQGPLPPAQAN